MARVPFRVWFPLRVRPPKVGVAVELMSCGKLKDTPAPITAPVPPETETWLVVPVIFPNVKAFCLLLNVLQSPLLRAPVVVALAKARDSSWTFKESPLAGVPMVRALWSSVSRAILEAILKVSSVKTISVSPCKLVSSEISIWLPKYEMVAGKVVAVWLWESSPTVVAILVVPLPVTSPVRVMVWLAVR